MPTYGPELIVNGDFAAGAAPWTAFNEITPITVLDGAMRLGASGIGQQKGLVIDSIAYYSISFRAKSISGGNINVLRLGIVDGVISETGRLGTEWESFEFIFIAPSAQDGIRFQEITGSTFVDVDDVSLRSYVGPAAPTGGLSAYYKSNRKVF